ncbi:MAG: glycosyltransferase [bacterium]|nr:glycosyltransferase [bacterium]
MSSPATTPPPAEEPVPAEQPSAPVSREVGDSLDPESEAGTETGAAPERATVDVSIVVPIQHPDAEVREVVTALGGQFDRLGLSWECLLVYDGIKGDIWEIGLSLQESSKQQVRTIALHKPFGESVCLSSAFDHTRGAAILTSPEYVQIDPHEIEQLMASIESGADVATSWRHPRVDAALNRVQSASFNRVMRGLVGASFHDLNCSLRVMRREVLEELTVYGNMYRYLPVIAHTQGFRVDEVQVRHLKERGGSGLFGPGVYGRRLLDVLGVVFLTKFTHKPLRFFGALGGLSMILGLLIAGGLAVQHLLNPSLELFSRPLFLLGVLFVVLGIQIVGFGLVGEIIIFTQARHVREYRIERIYE